MLKYKFDVKKEGNREPTLLFAIWHGNLNLVPETGQVANEEKKELGSCEQSPN